MHKLLRIVRYPAKVARLVVKLPAQHELVQMSEHDIETLKRSNVNLEREIISLKEQLDDRIHLVHSLDDRLSDLKQAIRIKEKDSLGQKTEPSNKVVNNTVSDNHALDNFYKLFEDRFRGTEEGIKVRLNEHTTLFTGLEDKLKKKPIVDLGCGRGELLSLLKDLKLKGIGVDMNKSMVERANSLGYKAVEDDALSYLSQQKGGSLAAITGFHIVEHIPFETLMEIFEECYRTLAPGGFTLFETPNPNNLMVGASNFYMDPSHIKPLPPELLAFAMESVGFKVEVLRLHPVLEEIEHEDKTIKDIMGMVYGSRDYAVVARKT